MKHRFSYKWYLKDGYPSKGIEKNNLKVFSIFCCGGGSSMGYKLAGFNSLGGVEIDKSLISIYKTNHKPKYLYNLDIRAFNELNDLPKELYDLDILDGSPPCSTFSMAGSREKTWGKKKKFREGQSKQILDDLVFVYINTIKKLKPKVAILENVKGLMQGNAKGYLKEIYKQFTDIGYNVQVFLLNAASMGVPQRRERVFIIGLRNDFDLPKLELKFNENSILFKEISEISEILNKKSILYNQWKQRKITDKNFGDICNRIHGKYKSFGRVLIHNNSVFPTIVSGNEYLHYSQFKFISNNEYCKVGTFPMDYNFQNNNVKYIIGMSVPPVMIAQISHQIYLQWLSKIINEK